MGANMTQRLLNNGHEVVIYDLDAAAIQRAEETGAVGARSLSELAAQLRPPRIVWMMVPAGEAIEKTINGPRPAARTGRHPD